MNAVLSRASRLTLVPCVAFTFAACGGSDSPTAAAPQTPVNSAGRIVITAPGTSVGLGDRLQLSSAVYLTGGTLNPQARPIWSVSDSSKARVDSAGVVTGFATGTVDIKADWLGTLGTFRVTFTPGTGAWAPGYLYGGANNDGGENIVADAEGNIYIGGSTAGSVDGGSASAGTGGSDALVTRMLPNGKKAWTRVVPTSGQNGANGIALHRDGGVVVNSSNIYGSHITYVNATGRIVWTNFVYNGGFNDVATDRAGNIYVTGAAIRQNGGTICPGVPQPVPNGAQTAGAGDGLLLKYAPDGRQLWCRLWTFVQSDQPVPKRPMFATDGVSIAIDETQGSIFIGGVVQLNAFFGLAPFIQRFSLADGSTDWSRFINPRGLGPEPAGRESNSLVAGKGILHGITLDGSGNIWAGMSEDSLGTFSDVGYSAYVVKLSATGTELLRRTVVVNRTTFAGSQNQRAVNAIAYRASSNDIVMIASYGATSVSRADYPNATVLAFDINGQEKWRQLITNAQERYNPSLSLRSLTSLPSGDIFLIGDTDYGPLPGHVSEVPAGGPLSSDILVTRITGRP